MSNSGKAFCALAYSQQTDSTHLVADLLAKIQQQGLDTKIAWGLLFCGEKLDAAEVFTGLREQLENLPIYGGSCTGTSNHSYSSSAGFDTLLLLFTDDIAVPKCHSVSLDLASDTTEQAIADVLYPVLSDPSDVMMFAATSLGSQCIAIDSVFKRLNKTPSWPSQKSIMGSLLTSHGDTHYHHIFAGHQLLQDQLILLVLPPELSLKLEISCVCSPASGFFEVTKVAGNQLVELDHGPAIETLSQRLIGTRRTISDQLLLGKKLASQYSNDDTAVFQIDTAIIDEEQSEVCCKEQVFRNGDMLQLMTVDSVFKPPVVTSGQDKDIRSSKTECWHKIAQFYFNSELSKSLLNNQGTTHGLSENDLATVSIPANFGIFSEAEIIQIDGQLLITSCHRIHCCLRLQQQPQKSQTQNHHGAQGRVY